MAFYMELSDKRASHSGSHKAWIHTGFAVKLGHSVSSLSAPDAFRSLILFYATLRLDCVSLGSGGALQIHDVGCSFVDVNSARWQLDEEARRHY